MLELYSGIFQLFIHNTALCNRIKSHPKSFQKMNTFGTRQGWLVYQKGLWRYVTDKGWRTWRWKSDPLTMCQHKSQSRLTLSRQTWQMSAGSAGVWSKKRRGFWVPSSRPVHAPFSFEVTDSYSAETGYNRPSLPQLHVLTLRDTISHKAVQQHCGDWAAIAPKRNVWIQFQATQPPNSSLCGIFVFA